MTHLQAETAEQYLQAHKAWETWRSPLRRVISKVLNTAARITGQYSYCDDMSPEEFKRFLNERFEKLDNESQEFMIQMMKLWALEDDGKINYSMPWETIWPLMLELEEKISQEE